MTLLIDDKYHAGSCTTPASVSGAAAAALQPAPPVSTEHVAEFSPTWLEHGRVPCLDGLRALSIKLVIIEHSYLASRVRLAGMPRQLLGNLGGVGVDVFFAISGFLITLLLLREWRRVGTISLKSFYARRFLRLMPAAAVFLATVFALQLAGYVHLEPRRWLHILTYTVNFDPHAQWQTGHLWSLSIEEQFYLMWPLALAALGPRWIRVVPVAWLLAAPLTRCLLLWLHARDMGQYENWTPFRIDCIAAGCLLALLADNAQFRRRTRLSRRAAMSTIVAAAVLLWVSYTVEFRVTLYDVALAHTVRAACIVTLIWLTVNHLDGAWPRLLEWKPFVVIGALSYSIYLWQQLFLVHGANHGPLALLVCVALAMAAAGMSYTLIERPFLQLKGRLPRRSRVVSK
jgi:peptidoglycan/LPS O-acetylase OafA/YrhL